MKRSEFVAKLHSEEDPWVTSVVELAEAAGCKWDPEEKPLPERITWRRYAAPLLFPEGVAGIFASPQEEEDCYDEAVRRFNAWRELRALVDCLGDDGLQDDRERRRLLLAILDGKETP